jgi:hypothetical protein
MMLLWPLHPHTRKELKAVFPLPTPAKGTLKVSGKSGVATAFFNVDRAKMNFNGSVSRSIQLKPVCGRICRTIAVAGLECWGRNQSGFTEPDKLIAPSRLKHLQLRVTALKF